MRLEAAFFAAQTAHGASFRRADLLVVDFDDTCTERDTIGPLLARAAEAAAERGGAGAAEAARALNARLSADYIARYGRLMAELLPPPPAEPGAAAAAPPPPYTLQALIECLSDFDAEMNRVVERAGALQGMDAAAAGAAVARGGGGGGGDSGGAGGGARGGGARLREGCARALVRAASMSVPVHVVSVNWSTAMVVAVLRAGGVEAEAAPAPATAAATATIAAAARRPPGAVVHANELAAGPDGLTTGLIDVRCECARDKARVFGEIEAVAARAAEAEASASGTAAAAAAAVSRAISPATGSKVAAAQSLERLRQGLEAQASGSGSQQLETAAAAAAAAAAGTAGAPTANGNGNGNGNGSSNGNDAARPSAPPPLSAYVGDSLSDLPALLAADFGIVVGSNGTLRRVLAAYGIPLLPLCAAATVPARRDRPAAAAAAAAGAPQAAAALFEAAGGWPEVEAFLFGPGSVPDAADPYYEGGSPPPSRSRVRDAAAAAAPAADPIAAVPAAPASDDPPRRAASDVLRAAVAAAGAAGARRPPPPLVLTIAGSDSGGGAGVQADLKTFLARGAFGMSCITALTAQNTAGVASVHVPPVSVLEAQLDAVLDDLGAAAVKTGMLPDGASVAAVARKLRQAGARARAAGGAAPALVVDPVLVTTSGHALAADGVAITLLRELFPLATVVTPNLEEASVLLAAAEAAEAAAGAGSDDGKAETEPASLSGAGGAFRPRGPVIDSVEGMRDAARRLHAAGRPRYVLVKGGHLAAASAARQNVDALAAAAAAAGGGGASATAAAPPAEALVAVDVLYDGVDFIELRAPYVRTANTHGTGCTLAAAVAAELARGRAVPEAVAAAKAYLTEALAASAGLAYGGGPQRPFDHGTWLLRRAGVDEGGTAAMVGGGGGAAAAAGAGSALSAAANVGRGPGVLQATGVSFNPCDLRVYAVTDPGLDAAHGRTVAQSVALAVAGGATIVQVRQKGSDGGAFLAAVRAAVAVCRAAGVPLLVNDRVDVALAAGADGVHVGQGDIPAAAARRMLGPRAIVGVSVKTPAEAIKAQADGADYLGTGAVYATGTKDSSVIGLEGLRAVCDSVDIPVVAIGGVSAANAEAVLQSAPRRRRPGAAASSSAGLSGGCAGLAVVSAIFGKEDARGAAEELRRAVEGALERRSADEAEA